MTPTARGSAEAKFRRTVWAHYRKHGRHDLPWRKTVNPYRILVSEVMLQQTQVDRVLPFYRAFLKRFPTAPRLAAASLAEVLRMWQGLGYNRRAKMLHNAAKIIATEGMPCTAEALQKLPGVGPYTARAVAAFAWNADGVLIETNIRTAVLHYFFQSRDKVADAEIEAVLVRAAPQGRAREWYWALMDYGAQLKRSGIRLNTRSMHHTPQKKFTGSLREARGAIVRALSAKRQSARMLVGMFGRDRAPQMRKALGALVKEGLIEKIGASYALH